VVRQVNVGKSPHGVWTLDHAKRASRRRAAGALALLLAVAAPRLGAGRHCEKPVYLTWTPATWASPRWWPRCSSGRTCASPSSPPPSAPTDGDSLDDHWAPWWKARAAEGHEFASHTYDHVYWRADLKGTRRASACAVGGPAAGREFTWTAAEYCANIAQGLRPAGLITGKKPLPLFRAPGGKTSPKLLAAPRPAASSTWAGRPPAFLGDELSEREVQQRRVAGAGAARRPQRRHPARAPGHLVAQGPVGAGRAGAADRRPEGQGLLLRTLREHPDYRAWIAQRGVAVMNWLTDLFDAAQQWLFEAGAAAGVRRRPGPLDRGRLRRHRLAAGRLDPDRGAAAVIGPLQRWRPVEPVVDRHAIRTDVLYTLIHRLGLFRLACSSRCSLSSTTRSAPAHGRAWGTWHLDEVWPGVTDVPWLSFAIYLLVFDFVDYWMHRGQHQFNWWWGLHSLHHSQRQMTMWSDNRNHLLDDLLRDSHRGAWRS
jgi:peptidoglycan/xylan/chitin deacetylase (PgdA/CDA1 family)